MTFEGEIFPNLQAAREAMLGDGDNFKYLNAKTGRTIKTQNAKNYEEVVLYSYNNHYGYKGMVLLKTIKGKGRIVVREAFDQNGDSSFNDLWEILIHQH